MKQHLAATALSVSLAAAPAFADDRKYLLANPPVTAQDMMSVSPALAKYTNTALIGDLWERPGLTPRDRSVITVATLIARNQTVEFAHNFNLALDNGVKPSELSEIITHLAFYAGWADATAAVAVAKDVFAARGVGPDQLPEASPSLLPLDGEKDAPDGPPWNRPSRPRLQVSRSLQTTSCSRTCGFAQAWLPGTGA